MPGRRRPRSALGPPGPSPGVHPCPGRSTRYAGPDGRPRAARPARRPVVAGRRTGSSRRPARRAAPGQHAQRAVRRGVALLHEVGLVDRLPVRARPRAPEGPRREQAAAADVPAHRVLHPTGELVLDPFAGVGGTLLGAAIAQGPRRALGIELDAALGRRLRRVARRAGGRARRPRPAPAPTSGRATRAARAPSTRPGWSSAAATRSRRCRSCRPARSTSSPPTRPTTSSCR